jgi:Phosphotransferase enzyme family
MNGALLKAYGIDPKKATITPMEGGLINNTWLVDTGEAKFVFQRINASVFKDPPVIAQNIREIGAFLSERAPSYLFPAPVVGENGKDLLASELGFFRLFRYIQGSHTIPVVENADQAYEAARQFGKFSALLSEFDVDRLQPTIPQFHDLSFRYEQFEHSILNGDPDRVREGISDITEMRLNKDLVDQYQVVVNAPTMPRRVIHHDTKISNVLFDVRDHGLCIIDLDTVMPGYFLSDFGDMVRTYLSPVSEEESEFGKISIREPFYRAIVQGYFEEMGPHLSEMEWSLIFYAGQFMIYMQALRFLTDYFRNDTYYGAQYESQNLVRARNQMQLLRKYNEKKSSLMEMLQQEKPRVRH